jgi:hypothetical protein
VALNPGRQFAQARNTQRWSNVNTLLNAVGQRLAPGASPLAHRTPNSKRPSRSFGSLCLQNAIGPMAFCYAERRPVAPGAMTI